MSSGGSIAENARIVYKALWERKMRMSAECPPIVHDDDGSFGDMLLIDDE